MQVPLHLLSSQSCCIEQHIQLVRLAGVLRIDHFKRESEIQLAGASNQAGTHNLVAFARRYAFYLQVILVSESWAAFVALLVLRFLTLCVAGSPLHMAQPRFRFLASEAKED